MKIESAMAEINFDIACQLTELQDYKNITQNIDAFLIALKDQLNCSPSDLFKSFYTPIIRKIGVNPDFTKMAELIPISFIANPQTRLNKIDKYIHKYKTESASSVSIRASCYRDLKYYEKAIELYKQSVGMDDYYYPAWNNMGQVYELKYKNYEAAKKCYEKAIFGKPDFDIPRLN